MTNNTLNNRGQIYMIAVVRFSDKTVCAHFSLGESDKEGVRELIASNPSSKPGIRYTVSGSTQSVHYILDASSRVYALVTHPRYPSRIAFGVLDELVHSFQTEFGHRLSSAPEDSLSTAAKHLFQDLCNRYGNPAEIDDIFAVQEKIEVVKMQMQDNISQLLINTEQLESISNSAEQLNTQSLAFKSSTTSLRRKMWWKMIKMKLLIGAIVLILLAIIIVPIVLSLKKKRNS